MNIADKLFRRVAIMVVGTLLAGYSCFGNLKHVTAQSKVVNKEFVYAFVDTDGAICSATVNCSLKENYTITSAGKVKYTSRSGYVGSKEYGNASISSRSVKAPCHYNENGSAAKTFAWKSSDYIVATGTKVMFCKKNGTDVTYSKKNKKYMQMAFIIGNSDFVLTPYKTGSISMGLSVC